MKKLCTNDDKEDGLQTILEVPIPEEMFPSRKKKWKNMKSWMKFNNGKSRSANREMQLLLDVACAPLIPPPFRSDEGVDNLHIKDFPIEVSMAKYIVKQYIAAVGGDTALESINSMYAMGKVKMVASQSCTGEDSLKNNSLKRIGKIKKGFKNGGVGKQGELGGFVLWQKRPDLWSLEMVVSRGKISAGSDGKVTWKQTPWHHGSRVPARPLRRSLQGLDPRYTANLFSNAVCTGEKTIDNEDCFILKLETKQPSLKEGNNTNVENIRHTIWGYFSQKTGLLVQLEDSNLLRTKSTTNEDIFWETTMESHIKDYRIIDGVNIAHAGRTYLSLFRFGDTPDKHSRTRMEEVWSIEEVDFNIQGLSMDCFLPPSDIEYGKVDEECVYIGDDVTKNLFLPLRIRGNNGSKVYSSKVVALDDNDDEDDE